jgi:twitching motility protein PilI
MREAAGARRAPSRLGFVAGGQKWLVELSDVSEVLVMPALLPVPLMQPWFLGIANIRGALYGVVDFSAFGGGAPLVKGPETSLIVLRGAARCCLAVERIVGVSEAGALDPSADGARSYVAAQCAGEDGATWKYLNPKALETDPVFMAIAVRTGQPLN